MLTDEQRGLLMFLRSRQLVKDPRFFIPQGIAELEAAIKENRTLLAIPIATALEEAGIPLSAWDGLPLLDTHLDSCILGGRWS